MKNLSLIYISKRNLDEEIRDLMNHEEIAMDSMIRANNPRELLVALSKNVKLYKNIILVGQIDGSYQNLVDIVSKASGISLEPVADDEISDDKFTLTEIPVGGMPIEVGNKVCGCIVERGGQKILFMPDSIYKLTSIIQVLGKYDWMQKSTAELVQAHSYNREDYVDGKGRSSTALKEKKKAADADGDYDYEYDDEDEHPRFVKPIGKDRSEAVDLDKIFGERKVQKGPMRFWVKLVITVCVLAVIGGGLFYVYNRWGAAWISDFVFSQTVGIYNSAEKGYDQNGNSIAIQALAERNSDVGAWVSIENTNINYPIVLSDQNGEEYYKNNCFFKFGNRYGTPYFDDSLSADLNSTNIVVYGSNVDGERVFAPLNGYRNLDFYKQNPVIYLDTLTDIYAYKIFAVVIDDKTDIGFDSTQNNFTDNADFEGFISDAVSRSYIITGVKPKYGDKLLSLSVTAEDFDNASLTVIAKRVETGEPTEVDVSEAYINDNQILPDMAVMDADNGTTEPPTEETIDPTESTEELTSEEEKPEDASKTVQNSSENHLTTAKKAEPTIGGIHVTSAQSKTKSDSAVKTTAKPTAKTTKASEKATEKKTTKPTVKSTTKATTKSTTKSPTKSTQATTKGNSGSVTKTTSSGGGSSADKNRISVSYNGKVYTDTRVNAIARIIEAEMGGGYQTEALKAQAIAAYNYVLCSQNGDTSKVVYNIAISDSAPSAKCLEAAKAVDGVAVKLNGNYIPLYFSAISAGKSAWGGDVWGGYSYTYTSSVDSSVDMSAPGFATTVTMSSKKLADYVKDYTDIDLTKIKDKTKWLRVTLLDSNGLYVNKIMIGEQSEYRGETFKLNIMKNKLRSHAFTVTYDAASDNFIFNVKGYGHGVGMSQYGANQYAKQGKDYKWILDHYYNLNSSGAVYVKN